MSDELAGALEVFARLIAREVVKLLRADQWTMIDQAHSPLGRRTHIAAVRRLVAAGSASAAIVGRRFLLSPEAIEAELSTISKRTKVRAPSATEVQEQLLAALMKKHGIERVPENERKKPK